MGNAEYMGSSFKNEASNWTDLKSINHLMIIKQIKKKSKRQSMTKNGLSFITIVVLSLIINLSSKKDVLVTAKSQSNNSIESQVNKETHSVKTSTAEQPCIRYCPGDSESDGGKSIAFLRLGRSGNEAEDDSEKEVRRAIDDAIKPQGSSASHNLTKRSNDAKEEEQSTAEDAATNPEDQEEGESFED